MSAYSRMTREQLERIADLADAVVFHHLDCMDGCNKAEPIFHALRVALYDAGAPQPFVEESREAVAEYNAKYPDEPLEGGAP